MLSDDFVLVLLLLLLLLVSLSTRDGLAAAGFDGSCLPIFAAVVEMTFCVDLGGVAGGGVGTGADLTSAAMLLEAAN